MVNQTCPMRYTCENLIEKFKCNGCGWAEFDFNGINLTEIEKIIIGNKERTKEDV